MAKFQAGVILVACKTSVAGKKMEEMVKDFGLTFNDCCVQGDFYFIQVPKGKENLWMYAFKGQPEVNSATRIPDFSR